MSFDCELSEAFSFVYRVEFDNRLVEHEYDHVLVGRSDASPDPDPSEVEDWRWMGVGELEADLRANPDAYSYWLSAALTEERRRRRPGADFFAASPAGRLSDDHPRRRSR
jgi:isopentenyl-diphosphate delta-isomerase